MWLLKLHFAVSILCLLTFIGFKHVGKEIFKQNGYIDENIKKKKVFAYWIFFIPILNVFMVGLEFVMLGMKKSDLEKWCKDYKERKNEN